jgi:hypothetical protein
MLKQGEKLRIAIEEATPEKMQEMPRILGVCNA